MDMRGFSFDRPCSTMINFLAIPTCSPATIPYPQIDPVIFRLGPLAVRWYGMAYCAGFVLAYLWARPADQARHLSHYPIAVE